jgi:hypothetical protein
VGRSLSVVYPLIAPIVLVITSRHGPHINNSFSIVAFVSVAARTCLPIRCPEIAAARSTENTVLALLSACMSAESLTSNGSVCMDRPSFSSR